MESDGEAAFLRHKCVRIMTEYAADPIWNKKGRCVPTDWLPVEPALIEALDEREREFDQAEPPPYDLRTTFDSSGHWDRGLKLAHRVKAQLPDWTVIYHQGSDRIEIA